MSLALDRSETDPESLRSLTFGLILEEPQDHDGTLLGRQRTQRPVQVDPSLSLSNEIGDGSWPGCHEHGPTSLGRALAPTGDRFAIQDLAKVAVGVVPPHPVPVPGQFDESGLQDILGLREVTADEVCRPQPGVLARLDEGGEVSVDAPRLPVVCAVISVANPGSRWLSR